LRAISEALRPGEVRRAEPDEGDEAQEGCDEVQEPELEAARAEAVAKSANDKTHPPNQRFDRRVLFNLNPRNKTFDRSVMCFP
jgi:hypothetical protein